MISMQRALVALSCFVLTVLPGCIAPFSTPTPPEVGLGPRTFSPTKGENVTAAVELLAAFEAMRGEAPPVDEDGNPLPSLQVTPWSEAIGLKIETATRKASGSGGVFGIHPLRFGSNAPAVALGIRDSTTTKVFNMGASGPLERAASIDIDFDSEQTPWWLTSIPVSGGGLDSYVIQWAHTDTAGWFEPGSESCSDRRDDTQPDFNWEGAARSFFTGEASDRSNDPRARFWDCVRVKVFVSRGTPESGFHHLGSFSWSPGWLEVIPINVVGRNYIIAHKPDGTIGVDRMISKVDRDGRETIDFREVYRSWWGSKWDRFMPFTLWGEQFLLAYANATGEFMMLHASQVDRNPDKLTFEVVKAGWWSKGWTAWVPMGESRDGFTYLAYNSASKNVVVETIGLDMGITTLAREPWDASGANPNTIVALPSTVSRVALAFGTSSGEVRTVTFTANADPARTMLSGAHVTLSSRGDSLVAQADGSIARGGDGSDNIQLQRATNPNDYGPLRYNELVRLQTSKGFLTWDSEGNVRADGSYGAPGTLWRIRQSGDESGTDPILRRFAMSLDTERGKHLFVTDGGSVDTRTRWIWEKSSGSASLHLV